MKKGTIILFLLLSSNFLFSQLRSTEKIKIKRETLSLNGTIFPVNGEGTYPTLLLLHGFPGNESDVLGIGEKLQKDGIVTLTFNYSGTFGSEGKYSMEYTMKDIKAAYEFLKEPKNVVRYHIDTTKIYLGGYSYGGGMSITYAANHPEIKKVFSIAGTDHGEFFREYFRNEDFAQMIDSMFDQLRAPNGPVRFEEGKMPKDISPKDVEKLDTTIDLRQCTPLISDRNILLFAGIDDPMVTMENHMLPLYRKLQLENAENVKFETFQDGHSFKKSRDKIAEIIINWLKD